MVNGKRTNRQNILAFFVKGYFEGRYKMKKHIVILVCLGILVVLPNLVLADCADIGGFSSFSVSGGNTIKLYSMNTPYAKFDVQGSIDQTSKLQLIKGYVCDGDYIMIDDSKCLIMSVSSGPPGY